MNASAAGRALDPTRYRWKLQVVCQNAGDSDKHLFVLRFFVFQPSCFVGASIGFVSLLAAFPGRLSQI
ncbi:MAG: hypothetical protein CMP23_09025 [Rickettsiales bacterium]|nr:hypothetical protein [Rickettsiales bacterium]